MDATERQRWLIVLSLFLTLFLVFGSGFNTAGVFFTPVIETFGWNRARLSSLQSAMALAAGLCVPFAGWLLDRVEARTVMATGAALTGCGLIAASQAHSYNSMLAAWLLVGLGLGSSTILPCGMVAANWFGDRRGIALGITMTGSSLGGMVMALIAQWAISYRGWRFGYLVLAAPIFLLLIPLIWRQVRTRPSQSEGVSVKQAGQALAGMEVGDALGSRSFWLISLAMLCFGLTVAGVDLHTVPYLIGIGYRPVHAALVLSLLLFLAGAGKLLMGLIADRIGGARAWGIDLLLMAAGIAALMGARRPLMLAVFMMLFGLASGASLSLLPMVIAESLGLRRFGGLAGLVGIFHTLGAALGPLIAGQIFDLNASYNLAFRLFVVVAIVGGCTAFGCLPLEQVVPDSNPDVQTAVL